MNAAGHHFPHRRSPAGRAEVLKESMEVNWHIPREARVAAWRLPDAGCSKSGSVTATRAPFHLQWEDKKMSPGMAETKDAELCETKLAFKLTVFLSLYSTQ